MNDDASGALDRVAREIGGMETVERLAALSGSDFASVMLEVIRRRAARQTPASVLRRYRHDRFVQPGGTSWRSVRRAGNILAGSLPANVEVMTLAPLVPLGTHSALGTVSQHKIVTTIRPCEVAADATNALALEAAVRRGRDAGRSVRLAAIQRVVRAQQFPAGWSAHFGLFGMVTAGRDEGSWRFEQAALAEHLRFAVAGLLAAELPGVQVALTPLSDAGERIAAAAAAELASTPAAVVMDHDRTAGRGYYHDVCFKVNALLAGVLEEIGDGGFTDWTAKLLASGKERLLIGGYGLDRLAALIGDVAGDL
ncbi:MAG: hypothetical protein JOY82_19360 [Streptosporangiaceae bacterium]|nr:hypothetical protein [Streptosporangiaceae bacterium]MBV9856644.1 hypothetical protein [Streptosporangiaceae bacterium]